MIAESTSSVAKVNGVLKNNDDVRYEMLLRNYWKDREYTQYGDDLGAYHNIIDRNPSPVGDGKLIYDYTWGNENEYSNKIRHQYLSANVSEQTFEVRPYDDDIQKWDGNYPEIFTEDRDENELSAVAQDKFTKDALLNVHMNENRALDIKYLTPELVKIYGTNPELDETTGFFDVYTRIGKQYNFETGRIADIPETEEAKIIHFYFGQTSLSGKHYLDQILNNAIKYEYLKGYRNQIYSTRDVQYIDYTLRDSVLGDGSIVGIMDDRYSHNTVGGKSPVGSTNRYNGDLVLEEYNEGDEPGKRGDIDRETNEFAKYSTLEPGGNSLLAKTERLFADHKLSTLVGRFHTSSNDRLNPNHDEISITDTAKSKTFGNSHGRNLLKLDATKGRYRTNEYSDPYCRVWTYHHQYDSVKKLIRPFTEISENGNAVAMGIEEVQKMNERIRTYRNGGAFKGGKYLADNTVLNKRTGIVNITPSSDKDNKVEIKNCMFSLENLAWKDVPKNKELGYIDPEQIGPNGGRIMWFPPYDLDFQESVNVDWDQNSFIGRGEKVYTYKNTDRVGTLSFSILIDHPGVIDLLQYAQPQGEEKDLEADVLRFFAGCNLLDIEELNTDEEVDAEIGKRENIPSSGNEMETIEEENKDEEIKFYVFFPNNYSGNMEVQTKDNWNVNGPSDPDWYKYLLNGVKTTLTPDTFEEENSSETALQYPGYEMTDGRGISGTYIKSEGIPVTAIGGRCTQWKRPPVSANDKQALEQIVDGKPIYSTERMSIHYNYRVDFDLAQPLKYQGLANYADSASFQLNSKLNGNQDILVGATHTFAEAVSALEFCNEHRRTKEKREGVDYGTTETSEIYKYVVRRGGDATSIQNMLKLLDNRVIESVEILGAATKQDSSVRINNENSGDNTTGSENEPARVISNKQDITKGCRNDIMLAQRRCKSLAMYIKERTGINSDLITEGIIEIPKGTPAEMTDVNNRRMKSQRYAVATIKFRKAETGTTEDANTERGISNPENWNTDLSVVTGEELSRNRGANVGEMHNCSQDFIQGSYRFESGSTYVWSGTKWEEYVLRWPGNRFSNTYGLYKGEQHVASNTDSQSGFLIGQIYEWDGSRWQNVSVVIEESYGKTYTNKDRDTEDVQSGAVAKKIVSHVISNGVRYGSEAEYFSKLSEESPLIYKNLISKFKYFNPAFHSISPEGFNARLTFLHQCTRQGHTIGASDVNGYAQMAGNLAFGRMPVCVLRIGDFINTRIIIQNMSINYSNNGIQWDLNPEGAGVQPMYAKVSLGIVILGGQSLSGPVSRLQNAVSFNYYANTGVYDNRSDIVKITDDKGIKNNIIRKEAVEQDGTRNSINYIDKSDYGRRSDEYEYLWAPYPKTDTE